MEQTYVAIDLEMTGLEVGEDEIIEVGAVKFRGNEIQDTFSYLVKPKRSLPLKITRITGITPEDLADAPTFNQIAPEFVEFVKDYPLVGHSASRDIGMLQAQGMVLPQPVYDTFDLATLLLPHMSAYKLVTLAEHLNISYTELHRALNDADLCRQVFLHLVAMIEHLDNANLQEVVALMDQTDWSIRELFTDIYRHHVRSAFQETAQPSTNADEKTQAGMLKNFWDEDSPEREKPLKPTGNKDVIDDKRIATFFAPDGAMCSVFASYEQRPQQVEMAISATDSFNNSKTILVEAGTGTGKSMAYLIPSAIYAMQRGEHVVVSTNTLNLQDQLFFKDIPDLQRMLEAEQAQSQQDTSSTDNTKQKNVTPQLTTALLKGRSNYLCLHRYNVMRHSGDILQPEEARMLLKTFFWLKDTSSGDGSEMMLNERERIAWSSVNVPPDTCSGSRCPEFNDCFLFKARRRAEASHIIIVNHALLLADLASQYQVLPPYNHLVVDEAHTLEDVATDQMSFTIDRETLHQFYDSLFQSSKTAGGLLSRIPTHFREGQVEEKYFERLLELNQETDSNISLARDATDDCFDRLSNFVNRNVETGGQGGGHATEHLYDLRLRITANMRQKAGWEPIESAWDNLQASLTVVGDKLGKIETLLTEVAEADIPSYDELLLQVQAVRRYVGEVRINIDSFILGKDEKICWFTVDRANDTLRLNAAPLDVAEIMQAQLFEQKQTVILTSATISIGDSFHFIKSRLGLTDVEELHLDSPFNYEKQAMIFIPNDIPEPNQRGYQLKVEEALIHLCTATGGRTLALFTANSAIKKTRIGIQDALEEQDIIVLGQSVDGSRRSLMEQFREWPRTVLLGTSSFWQGVDVVGDALSVLVIAKLPFSVPSDPIFAARSEQFQDPFSQYAVPQSILRFKQGFGRLIRSKEDKGIVVVLDKRLLTKGYGMTFLQSLPQTTVREGALKHLPAIAAKFLAR